MVVRSLAVSNSWPAGISTGPMTALWIGMAAALTGVGVAFSPPLTAMAICGLIWMCLLVRYWSVLAPLTLITCIGIPRYEYTIGAISINAERIVIPALFGLLLVRHIGNPLVYGRAHLLLLLSVVVSAVSSAVNAPDTGGSLRLTLLTGITCLPFLFVPNIARDAAAVRRLTFMFIGCGILEALFGQVAVAANALYGVNIGVQFDALTGGWAAYGSQWEGNTFGSFVAASAVLTMAWLVAADQSRRTRVLAGLALGVLISGLVVSLSRGAWLGAAAGAMVVLVSLPRRWTLAALVGVALAFMGLVTLIDGLQTSWPGTEGSAALTRLSLLSDPIQGTFDGVTVERLYTYDLAFRGWLDQPIIGWGAGSLGERSSYVSVELPAWVGNLELHALHDTGVLGAVGLLGAMGSTLVALIRALCRRPGVRDPNRALLAGLLAACITLLVAYQATEATWLGYTWCVFGLAWAAARSSGAPSSGQPISGASGWHVR
jgi:O-antigen ligase